MKLTVEFSGGLELLFGGKKNIALDVIFKNKAVMSELLVWMRDNLVTERPDLFMKSETVRPGILVLINEADWELCGTLDAELKEGDNVVFISTLHGG
ncbi:hypothetical protein CEUSTIGMA_g13259.t1 [Chlamydomonas eustigma]|uniref:Ubiquitin-related modifier 1 homolog n=1 Tax=Chlamydomonas eustigma TaxID=1157962 RepID=A0A250XS14_9CHLO|nr:hypothetical protein CEUSTIGMA_g13259.t1 [Chlamydomonas eustigma]|eukprot:GAX85844.1 hypothetical protein CEUSTIGMA_g13259.t1 [Chlamydomonas eustigma]